MKRKKRLSQDQTTRQLKKRKWLWQRAIIIQRWSALSSFFYFLFSIQHKR
jgi:hypothetical protein